MRTWFGVPCVCPYKMFQQNHLNECFLVLASMWEWDREQWNLFRTLLNGLALSLAAVSQHRLLHSHTDLSGPICALHVHKGYRAALQGAECLIKSHRSCVIHSSICNTKWTAGYFWFSNAWCVISFLSSRWSYRCGLVISLLVVPSLLLLFFFNLMVTARLLWQVRGLKDTEFPKTRLGDVAVQGEDAKAREKMQAFSKKKVAIGPQP